MAAVAAVQLAGASSKVGQSNALPVSDACSYMMRMDYCKVLGIERDEGFARHDPCDRFVPLTAIPIDEMESDPGGTAERLARVIEKNTDFSGSAADIMNLSFSEAIDNIVQHSAAPSPGIAGAQWFPNLGYVETCVADCGIGIPGSMSSNDAYLGLSDDELLKKAFEYQSGQWYGKSEFGTREVSGGVGLCYSAGLARKLGGHLWAVSHSSAIHISENGVEALDDVYYPGTVVVLRIPNTTREVLDTDVFPDGEGRVIRYEAGEGQYLEEDNVLW